MPKVPEEFCIDSFVYEEYEGVNSWNAPSYAAPKKINNVRIDRGAEYSSNRSGKQLLYNSLIFCYEGISTPLLPFKTESKITFDDVEHIITKVIPIYEAYEKKLYSYEIEVV